MPHESTISRRAVMTRLRRPSLVSSSTPSALITPPSDWENSSAVASTLMQTCRFGRSVTTSAGKYARKLEWRRPVESIVYCILVEPMLGSKGDCMSRISRKPIFRFASAVLEHYPCVNAWEYWARVQYQTF